MKKVRKNEKSEKNDKSEKSEREMGKNYEKIKNKINKSQI